MHGLFGTLIVFVVVLSHIVIRLGMGGTERVRSRSAICDLLLCFSCFFSGSKAWRCGNVRFHFFSLVTRRTAGQAKRCTDGKDEKKKNKLKIYLEKRHPRDGKGEILNTW